MTAPQTYWIVLYESFSAGVWHQLAEITSISKCDAEGAMIELRGEPNDFRNIRGPFEWREPGNRGVRSDDHPR